MAGDNKAFTNIQDTVKTRKSFLIDTFPLTFVGIICKNYKEIRIKHL